MVKFTCCGRCWNRQLATAVQVYSFLRRQGRLVILNLIAFLSIFSVYFVFGIVSLSVLIFFSCCVYCEEKVIEKQRTVTVRSLLYTGTCQFWQAGFRLLLRYLVLLLAFPDVTSPFTHSCFVIVPVSVHQEWY